MSVMFAWTPDGHRAIEPDGVQSKHRHPAEKASVASFPGDSGSTHEFRSVENVVAVLK